MTQRRHNAPINVNPVGGGGGVRARGRAFDRAKRPRGRKHLTLTDRGLVSIQKRLPSPSLEAF